MSWDRATHRAALEDGTFDTVVVGGGIVGAGVALDLATRGLKVALLERTDFGSETSSRSTKMLHGGIRYLPQMQFGLVREGLLEQKVLERIADYLFEPLQLLLPYYSDRGFGDVPKWIRHPRLVPKAFGFGLWLYDRLGRRTADRRHHHLSREEVLARAPKLDPKGLTGGFTYFDALTDDTRLTLAVTKTAVDSFDAIAVNWLHVESIAREGDGFRVQGYDRLGNTSVSLTSRSVVSATGPFPPPGVPRGAEGRDLLLSKGIHLVIDAEPLGISDAALVLPETDDERVFFIIPWLGKTWVGTTDTKYRGDPDHPLVDDADIEYAKRQLHEYLKIDDVEIVSAVAGIRALAASGTNTSKASRAPKIEELTPGYVRVAGGKLTGYRPMAVKVGNRVVKHLGIGRQSKTRDQLLSGAGGGDVRFAHENAAYRNVLQGRYGTNARFILEVAELGIMADDRLSEAEVAYLVHEEAAATISDVLLRRTHLALLLSDHGRALAPGVAAIMGRELDWSPGEVDLQIKAYEEELISEGL